MHHRIANQNQLDNIFTTQASLFCRTINQRLQSGNHRLGHFGRTARIHDAV